MRIMENSRRTLRQGTELGKENEDEIRKEDAHQHQRSSGSSEFDVANAHSGRSHEPNNEIQTGRNIPSASGEDVADTSVQGLEGSLNEKLSTPERSQRLWPTPRGGIGNDIQAVAGNGEFTDTRSIWKRK